jgi:hypothetical protein
MNDVSESFGLGSFDVRHEGLLRKKHPACAVKTAMPGQVFVYVGQDAPVSLVRSCVSLHRNMISICVIPYFHCYFQWPLACFGI